MNITPENLIKSADYPVNPSFFRNLGMRLRCILEELFEAFGYEYQSLLWVIVAGNEDTFFNKFPSHAKNAFSVRNVNSILSQALESSQYITYSIVGSVVSEDVEASSGIFDKISTYPFSAFRKFECYPL
jgi:hypothetical protein